MKKVTLAINDLVNADSAKNISAALNDLSGVVAADTSQSENIAYAYAGDKLKSETMESTVRQAGYNAKVTSEEYLNNVNDFKNSIK